MPRSKSGTGVRSHRCSCDQSHIRSDGTSYLSPFPQLSHSFLVKYIVLPTPLCGVPCPCYAIRFLILRSVVSFLESWQSGVKGRCVQQRRRVQQHRGGTPQQLLFPADTLVFSGSLWSIFRPSFSETRDYASAS